MNVLIFDVPAESGGALSVLTDFYDEVKNHKDKTITWTFILSKPEFQETDNIKILRFPWIKKSWLHRFYFDQVIAPKLVKKLHTNKIFSLQNVIIPRTNVEQIVYVHQSLPFVDYKFKFTENKLFWVNQNIISKKIYKGIRNAKKVIVQTDWFKQACIEKTGVIAEKIEVVSPQINVNVKKYFSADSNTLSTFFYPSSAESYKNHKVIVEACNILKSQNVVNFKVLFTLNGYENNYISELKKKIEEKGLPIVFIGHNSRGTVFDYYTESVLLFPSYIETFGLPMLEAKLHGDLIFASDNPFSHEILDDYNNSYFFDSFNGDELAALMLKSINGEIAYHEIGKTTDLENANQKNSLVDCVLG